MPNKYPLKKGLKIPKQRYRISNWREYNEPLHQRGQIEFWITEEEFCRNFSLNAV